MVYIFILEKSNNHFSYSNYVLLNFREESFIPYIDDLPELKRNVSGPFMMPIVDKFSDMGTIVIGKVESGDCVKGQTLAIYPNRTEVKVDQLWSDDIEVTKVVSGENIKVKVKGIEEADVTPGFVLCDPTNPIKSCKTFDAQVGQTDVHIEVIVSKMGKMRKFYWKDHICLQ